MKFWLKKSNDLNPEIEKLRDRVDGLYYELTKTKEKLVFLEEAKKKVVLLYTKDDKKKVVEEIIRRSKFYLGHIELNPLKISSKDVDTIYVNPVLCTFLAEKIVVNGRAINGIFNVDYEHNHLEGWQWHNLLRYLNDNNLSSLIIKSKKRLLNKLQELKSLSLQKCYVFGTGPSLDMAIDHDWDDGYRVVCNTVVRDEKMWRHLNPHIFVAGDPMYHFGFTKFAAKFRNDLKKRLRENQEVLFIYPIEYDTIARREFSEFEDRLVAMPVGMHKTINIDFAETFSLPNMGNVLSLLLLPIACSLSKQIFLWGFDGRNPKDKLFWKNSKKHTYDEHMDELVKAHPAFFEYNVPINDPNKYVRQEQGDELDGVLKNAEVNGWRFEMMHNSWTAVLQKRFSSL